MVGIVLASHGGFADGIFQSAEMIFGKQENLALVILKPVEGPDDIRAQMEKAVAYCDVRYLIKQTILIKNMKILGLLFLV